MGSRGQAVPGTRRQCSWWCQVGIDTRAAGANDEVVTETADERPDDGAANAVATEQLSAQNWRDLVRRALGHVVDARLPFLSAGVAFFAVLSVAPVLVTALSVYGALNSGLKRLVRASERTDVSIHDLFAAAAEAIAPAPPPAGQLRPVTRAMADQLIAAAGWTHVRPDSPDRENLAATLELIASQDTHPRDPAEIEPYLRFADQIASCEIGHLDDAKDRIGLLEEMLVGQVVFGEVLATLRRLAEEHHSLQRFGDDYRA